jgi:hypothetical protein
MNNGMWRKSVSLPQRQAEPRNAGRYRGINIRDEEGLLDIIHRLLMTDKISSATSVEVAKATSGRIAIALRSLSDRFFPLLSARGMETADGAWEEIDNVSREDPLAHQDSRKRRKASTLG